MADNGHAQPVELEDREPVLPAKRPGPVGLSPDELAADIHMHVSLDEKFKPLLALLHAAEKPAEDFEAEIQSALQQIRADNAAADRNKAEDEPILPHFVNSSEVLESDGLGALVAEDVGFRNWGETVKNTPATTWVIRTREGVRNVVKWAAGKGKRVRVAGFRHSWTNIFGADGDVIIMFQPFSSLVNLPYKSPGSSWVSDLQGVTGPISSVAGRTPPSGHAFFKVGAGTVNDDFRKWCFANKKYCIPLNVIMVEVTFGGTNAPVCHGAGLGTSTLSDLVVEVEYVDAKGDIQVVNDPTELRAASGCFGLLGVVISLTLQLDDMSIAELAPVKLDMVLAIPPPEGYPIPKVVQGLIKDSGITPKDLADAREAFIKRCEEDYYLEWFWFPYQRDCWVNTWKKRPVTPQDAHIETYPGDNLLTGASAQAIQGSIAEEIVKWKWWYRVSGHNQAFWFGLASMAALPNVKGKDEPIQAYQSDALHFRRGIQNFRVWDTEWEIPIPEQAGKRDYSLVQRAWWDAISEMYAKPEAPVRVALEMRLTGSSSVLLAPQRGNTGGTVSIEVLTTLTTPPEVWDTFRQTMADKWTSYTNPYGEEGELLNARPHWAKQWEGLTVRGKPIEQYLASDAYAGAFGEFRETFEKVVTGRGGSVAETRARFGTATIEGLIWGDVAKGPVSNGSSGAKRGRKARASSSRGCSCVIC